MASYLGSRRMINAQTDSDNTSHDDMSWSSSRTNQSNKNLSNSLLSYNISNPNSSYDSMEVDPPNTPQACLSPTKPSFFRPFQRKSLDNGRFIVLDTLGKGATAKVKLGVDTHSGERVALKIIEKRLRSKKQAAQIQREIRSMLSIRHPNVLCLHHYDTNLSYPRGDGTNKDCVLLVIELSTGGELFEIMMHTGALGESITRHYAKQLLGALSECHRMGVYHRDLKPENLLLDSKWNLKIADFGHSAMKTVGTDSSSSSTFRTVCGTKAYMAPEVLENKLYDGSQIDIWSAGVVIFIMLTGNPPFQIANKNDWWFNAIASGRLDRFWRAHLRVSKNVSHEARNFVEKMLVIDPLKRYRIDQLLLDPWLNEQQNASDIPLTIEAEMQRRVTLMQRQKDEERNRLSMCLARESGG